MSVRQANVIDGMGIDKNTNKLVFLITDPYAWAVQEYEHLTAIQAKINNYVRYIETESYSEMYKDRKFDGYRIEISEMYKDRKFDGYRIEIVFKYKYTENGEAFLNAGKKQLKERNIDFIYSVAKAE